MSIVVAIPGLAYSLALRRHPDIQALKEAELVRRGVGHQAILTLTAEEADELLTYFRSNLSAPVDMTFPEYWAGNVHIAARLAARRIEAAIRETRD